jgi:hypothetical protein
MMSRISHDRGDIEKAFRNDSAIKVMLAVAQVDKEALQLC